MSTPWGKGKWQEKGKGEPSQSWKVATAPIVPDGGEGIGARQVPRGVLRSLPKSYRATKPEKSLEYLLVKSVVPPSPMVLCLMVPGALTQSD